MKNKKEMAMKNKEVMTKNKREVNKFKIFGLGLIGIILIIISINFISADTLYWVGSNNETKINLNMLLTTN